MFGIKTRIIRHIKTHTGIGDHPVYFRMSPVGYARCNHACPMCLRTNVNAADRRKLQAYEDARLTIEEYRTLFASMPRTIKYVDIVGGGEPLLYPQIAELFAMVKTRGMHGRLITNGALMSRSIAATLLETSWDQVRVSIHAGTARAYRVVNGVDDFRTVVTNVRALSQMRGKRNVPMISLMFVIQRGNHADIPSFVRLARSLHVDEIQFDSLIPVNPSTVPTAAQTRTIVRDLRRVRTEATMRNNIDEAIHLYASHPRWSGTGERKGYFTDKYCALAQENLDMTCNGRIGPCCIAPAMGSVRTDPIAAIWKRLRPFRRNVAEGRFAQFCYDYCTYDLPRR